MTRTAREVADHLNRIAAEGRYPGLDETLEYAWTLDETDRDANAKDDEIILLDGSHVRFVDAGNSLTEVASFVGAAKAHEFGNPSQGASGFVALSADEARMLDEQSKPCPVDGCVLGRTQHDAHADYDTALWLSTSTAALGIVERAGHRWYTLPDKD